MSYGRQLDRALIGCARLPSRLGRGTQQECAAGDKYNDLDEHSRFG
jgi:hypothetical protein